MQIPPPPQRRAKANSLNNGRKRNERKKGKERKKTKFGHGRRKEGRKETRGVMIPAWVPDPESDFQVFFIPESDPVKSGIVPPI